MATSNQAVDQFALKDPQHTSNDLARDKAVWSAAVESKKVCAVGIRQRRRAMRWAVFVLWGLAAAVGSLYGFWYEMTPTATDIVRDVWPAESSCRLSSNCPTLLMLVHPRCPCSRSSLDELAVLMTRCRDRVTTHVLFFTPPSAPAEWARSDLWDQAARIPGVVPRVDPGGIEHRRFGARVSGEVLLFRPDGGLVFHGGITASRGHAGDNVGRSALESYLMDGVLPAETTPVFGCVSDSSERTER